jgi:hypothetical protein
MADVVIQLDQWRVRKEGSRAAPVNGLCDHRNLTMDQHGLTVRCDDCQLQLSAYWVLENLVDSYRRARDELARAQQAHLLKARAHIHLPAAQRVETAWRSRHMIPTCPHCSRGIFPEDGFGGSMVPKAAELARRQKIPVPVKASDRPEVSQPHEDSMHNAEAQNGVADIIRRTEPG